MEYSKAHQIAIKLLRQFEKCCLKSDIAGSVAREKPECKDIEICCLPCFEHNVDLFGATETEARSLDFIKLVKSLGIILKGKPEDGRYVQIALTEGINLDLFIPQAHDYYRQYATRIGSRDYSHKVLATAWNKIGWVGTDDGLRMESECYRKAVGIVNGKTKFKHFCNSKNPTLPPVWDSEYELFKWLGLDWIPPKNRNA